MHTKWSTCHVDPSAERPFVFTGSRHALHCVRLVLRPAPPRVCAHTLGTNRSRKSFSQYGSAPVPVSFVKNVPSSNVQLHWLHEKWSLCQFLPSAHTTSCTRTHTDNPLPPHTQRTPSHRHPPRHPSRAMHTLGTSGTRARCTTRSTEAPRTQSTSRPHQKRSCSTSSCGGAD